MSKPPFTPAQQKILGQVGKVLGQMFGGLVYMQLRLAAPRGGAQGTRADHRRRDRGGQRTREEPLGTRADDRRAVRQNLAVLLEELRRRMGDAETS